LQFYLLAFVSVSFSLQLHLVLKAGLVFRKFPNLLTMTLQFCLEAIQIFIDRNKDA